MLSIQAHPKMLISILEKQYPGMVREYAFHPERKWRFDFAWPGKMVAMEIEGGTWTAGRHTRGKGYENDCIKYSTAAIMGWVVIRATTGMVNDGRAYLLLNKALSQNTGDHK